MSGLTTFISQDTWVLHPVKQPSASVQYKEGNDGGSGKSEEKLVQTKAYQTLILNEKQKKYVHETKRLTE